jgi:hypothetical protein
LHRPQTVGKYPRKINIAIPADRSPKLALADVGFVQSKLWTPVRVSSLNQPYPKPAQANAPQAI